MPGGCEFECSGNSFEFREFGLLAQLSRELEQSEAEETQGIPFIQSTPNGELAIPMV